MAYKILERIKLGKKLLGHTVVLDDGVKAFVAKRPNRDHIYMGGNAIAFTDAEKEGKLEWAVNEAKIKEQKDKGVELFIVESGYYSKRFIAPISLFFDDTKVKRFRHYDNDGSPLDYQRSLNFYYFKTEKMPVTKLS